jgi:hypothetical protein
MLFLSPFVIGRVLDKTMPGDIKDRADPVG